MEIYPKKEDLASFQSSKFPQTFNIAFSLSFDATSEGIWIWSSPSSSEAILAARSFDLYSTTKKRCVFYVCKGES